MFPYKCRLFGYVLMVVWNVACFFVVLVYGLKFDSEQEGTLRSGTSDSEKWVVSVLTAQLMVLQHSGIDFCDIALLFLACARLDLRIQGFAGIL
jgi:hypothetical protein